VLSRSDLQGDVVECRALLPGAAKDGDVLQR
jgi:hypothetical protein